MAIPNTKLTRRQYIAKANEWLKKNPDKWKQIRASTDYPYKKLQSILEKDFGKPLWRDERGRNKITGSLPTKNDPGVPFTIYPTGDSVGFKSNVTRKATRGQPTGTSSGTRQYLEHAASKPGTDFVDANRAMGEANAIGMDGGHITPLDRKVAGQEWSVQNGRNSVQQINQNFDNANIPYGHSRPNIQPQKPLDNRVLQRQGYAKMDRNLKHLASKTDDVFGPLKKLGGIPVIAGLTAAGLELASTGNPASAALAFVDTENPINNIDSGPVADGTLAANTPEAVAARRQQLQQQRTAFKQTIKQGIRSALDFLIQG